MEGYVISLCSFYNKLPFSVIYSNRPEERVPKGHTGILIPPHATTNGLFPKNIFSSRKSGVSILDVSVSFSQRSFVRAVLIQEQSWVSSRTKFKVNCIQFCAVWIMHLGGAGPSFSGNAEIRKPIKRLVMTRLKSALGWYFNWAVKLFLVHFSVLCALSNRVLLHKLPT